MPMVMAMFVLSYMDLAVTLLYTYNSIPLLSRLSLLTCHPYTRLWIFGLYTLLFVCVIYPFNTVSFLRFLYCDFMIDLL